MNCKTTYSNGTQPLDIETLVKGKVRDMAFKYAKKENFADCFRNEENKYALIRAGLVKGWQDGFAEACYLLGVSMREAINALERQKTGNL